MDRFMMMEHLKTGQHSVTYVANDWVRREPVVLKLLDWLIPRTCYLVRHSNNLEWYSHHAVVKTLETFPVTSNCVMPEGLPFRPKCVVVTEYCEGGNLDDWLKRNPEAGWPERFNTFNLIAEGLVHLHGLHLMHGNIKGSNVVYKSGNPKLCDAMVACDGGSRVGTSPYSSPEARIRPEWAFSYSSDRFSLGVLLVQLFIDPVAFTEWISSESPSQFPVFVPNSPECPSHIRTPPTLSVESDMLDLMKGLLCYNEQARISSRCMRECLEIMKKKPQYLKAINPPISI